MSLYGYEADIQGVSSPCGTIYQGFTAVLGVLNWSTRGDASDPYPEG